MNNFIDISPKSLERNPFKLIGEDWMLITAEKDGKVNTMTASWGGLGVMWGKDVAFTVIRPTRYTKEFVDNSDTFSLSFLNRAYKEELSYLGTVSGRDEDKITKSKLTVAHFEGTPYFDEAEMVMICKKLFAQPYNPESFIGFDEGKWYPNKDYHTLYISEITKVLIR